MAQGLYNRTSGASSGNPIASGAGIPYTGSMEPVESVAIVTGGERGIGRGIVEELLERGCKVVVGGIDGESADQLRKDLDQKDRLKFRHADVRDENAVAQLVSFTVDTFGRLDGMVCNAGLPESHGQAVEALSLEEWNRVIATNLTGMFLCAKYGFPELRKTRGAMVLIASTRALQSEPDSVAYTASKGGVLALTHSLAISGGPEIRVNAISPGWIHHGDPSKLPESAHAQHPVGRVGTHRDIAKMTAFLLSGDAAFITAEHIVVDGGMTRKMIYT